MLISSLIFFNLFGLDRIILANHITEIPTMVNDETLSHSFLFCFCFLNSLCNVLYTFENIQYQSTHVIIIVQKGSEITNHCLIDSLNAKINIPMKC